MPLISQSEYAKRRDVSREAVRQARLRERRKAQGFRRVSVWLSPDQVDSLERLGGEPWLGTRVKQLLESAVVEPARPPVAKQVALFVVPDPEKRGTRDFEPAAVPVSDNATALWREADSLNKAGLSWAEIARQWNEQGRRTGNGAEYRGANISREVRKLKGEGE